MPLSHKLYGRWLHSHEEDTATETVYRLDSFKFPPSRGRAGFDLREDGSATMLVIGATDRREEVPERWSLNGDQLTVGPRSMKIIRADSGKLIVGK